jgi:hypothetical protein
MCVWVIQFASYGVQFIENHMVEVPIINFTDYLIMYKFPVLYSLARYCLCGSLLSLLACQAAILGPILSESWVSVSGGLVTAVVNFSSVLPPVGAAVFCQYCQFGGSGKGLRVLHYYQPLHYNIL